jgi:hypothetical protein
LKNHANYFKPIIARLRIILQIGSKIDHASVQIDDIVPALKSIFTRRTLYALKTIDHGEQKLSLLA